MAVCTAALSHSICSRAARICTPTSHKDISTHMNQNRYSIPPPHQLTSSRRSGRSSSVSTTYTPRDNTTAWRSLWTTSHTRRARGVLDASTTSTAPAGGTLVGENWCGINDVSDENISRPIIDSIHQSQQHHH